MGGSSVGPLKETLQSAELKKANLEVSEKDKFSSSIATVW